MKRVLIITFVFLAIFATKTFAQKALNYTEVVKVEGISKEELYNRAKYWFVTKYHYSQDALQLDKGKGQITGKATIDYTPSVVTGSRQTAGNIQYKIKLFVADEYYKYEITEFIHNPSAAEDGKVSLGLLTTDENCPNAVPMTTKGWRNKVWVDLKKRVQSNAIPLIANLKESMKVPAGTTSEKPLFTEN